MPSKENGEVSLQTNPQEIHLDSNHIRCYTLSTVHAECRAKYADGWDPKINKPLSLSCEEYNWVCGVCVRKLPRLYRTITRQIDKSDVQELFGISAWRPWKMEIISAV